MELLESLTRRLWALILTISFGVGETTPFLRFFKSNYPFVKIVVRGIMSLPSESQAQERLKAGGVWQSGDYVFCSQIGAPLAHSTYYNAWRRTLRRSEVKGFNVHSLRHTHISTLLRQGIALNIVARRVGDKPETILRTYAHCLPQDDLKCAQVFEEALGV